MIVPRDEQPLAWGIGELAAMCCHPAGPLTL